MFQAELSPNGNERARLQTMTGVGQPERVTQNRVIALFRNELGYRYLGDCSE